MHLVAAPGWNRPFCKERVGLQVDYRQTYLDVVFVAPGSPADKAGWHVGDRITAIDAKPIGADYHSALPDWWCGEPGSSLVLSDDRGAARRLVFADFS
jgi:C-terminal processing protease CtpA/Prc